MIMRTRWHKRPRYNRPPIKTPAPLDPGKDILNCYRCRRDFLRKELLNGEACPHCKLVGDFVFTGKTAK